MANKAYVWGLFNQNVGLNQIVDSGYTLCWAAKWLGQKEVYFSSINDGVDNMLSEVHKLLDEADVVVTYNGERFDLPTLNKEFIKNSLLPPKPYKQIDLLKVARKRFKFASNKLDYVAKFLGLKGKIKHKGFDLWKECDAGDPVAWRKMESYNRGDVVQLEQVYYKMLPWIPNHPNHGVYADGSRPICPTCGSNRLQKRGQERTKTAVYQRFVCTSCGSWSRTRHTEVSKEHSKNILVSV